MQHITAETKPLRVDYRVKGKSYLGQVPEGRAAENTDERSDYAFDSTELKPGETLRLNDGDELVRVTTLGEGGVAEENPYLGG